MTLVGRGMTQSNYGSVPHGIWTGNGVTNLTIAGVARIQKGSFDQYVLISRT